YINQPDAPSTGELACIVGYPVGILTLKAGFMYDIVEYTGALYTQEGVEIEKELTDQVSASGALMLGAGSAKFNDAYFGLSKATASLLSIDGRLTWTLPTGLYLQPWFQYNRTLNHELKPYLKNHTSSFGLTAGKEF
ncbi:MAG TPA: hypothetical protein PLG50_10095, partial [bacterium]|nr:hypothetical protein [bacterium]